MVLSLEEKSKWSGVPVGEPFLVGLLLPLPLSLLLLLMISSWMLDQGRRAFLLLLRAATPAFALLLDAVPGVCVCVCVCVQKGRVGCV